MKETSGTKWVNKGAAEKNKNKDTELCLVV